MLQEVASEYGAMWGSRSAKNFGVAPEGLPEKSVAESQRTGPEPQCVPTPPFVLVAPDGHLARRRRRRGGVIRRHGRAGGTTGYHATGDFEIERNRKTP